MVSLRARGRKWRDLGLARPPRFARAIAIGIAAGLALELFSTYVSVPFLARMTGEPPDLSDFASVVGNVKLLLVMLALNWTLAAFGEEIAFRGYIMGRLADAGRRSDAAWLVALVASSALFGWGHGGQGLAGMLQESFAGFVLGVMFLASGRNLVVPIVAHGVSNTLAFVLIYLGRYPGI